MRLIEISEQASNPAVFTFGRFNPPTIGHGKLLDKVASVRSDAPHYIFVSHTTDSKKNPLDYETKISFMKRQFGKHTAEIVQNEGIRTIIDIMQYLEKQGHDGVIMVAGSDRVKSFNDLLQKYNGQEYMLPEANRLLSGIKEIVGEFVVLSKALSGDPRAEKQKRAWVQTNLSIQPVDTIIMSATANKGIYAKQSDGTPNVLIDDFGVNIKNWQASGGTAIKYKDGRAQATLEQLRDVYEN